MYRWICYEELAHVLIEAEKMHNLPSVSWRSRKSGGVIQSESKDLRTRGADGISPSPRSGEDVMSCPSSSIEAREEKGLCGGMNSSFLYLLFYSGPQLIG